MKLTDPWFSLLDPEATRPKVRAFPAPPPADGSPIPVWSLRFRRWQACPRGGHPGLPDLEGGPDPEHFQAARWRAQALRFLLRHGPGDPGFDRWFYRQVPTHLHDRLAPELFAIRHWWPPVPDGWLKSAVERYRVTWGNLQLRGTTDLRFGSFQGPKQKAVLLKFTTSEQPALEPWAAYNLVVAWASQGHTPWRSAVFSLTTGTMYAVAADHPEVTRTLQDLERLHQVAHTSPEDAPARPGSWCSGCPLWDACEERAAWFSSR